MAGQGPELEAGYGQAAGLVMTMRMLLIMEPEPTSCSEVEEDKDYEDGLESSQLSTTKVTPLLSTRLLSESGFPVGLYLRATNHVRLWYMGYLSCSKGTGLKSGTCTGYHKWNHARDTT